MINKLKQGEASFLCPLGNSALSASHLLSSLPGVVKRSHLLKLPLSLPLQPAIHPLHTHAPGTGGHTKLDILLAGNSSNGHKMK